MKSVNVLVITYLYCTFCGAQAYDYKAQYNTASKQTHHLQQQVTDTERSIRSIDSQQLQQNNQSTSFIAAGLGSFPNCQIYGRTYCTDIEGYPE